MFNRFIFPILLMVCFLLENAFCGGIYNNSNQSAEYVRTFNRNAVTDSADAAYYNPAGLTQLKAGFHFNLSNQFVFQPEYTIRVYDNDLLDRTDYYTSNTIMFFPNLYGVYRQSNWALFSSIQTIAAGATREWDNGLPTLDLLGKQLAVGAVGDPDISRYSSASDFEGTSYYIAYQIGGAYAVNDWLSLALAGKYISAYYEYDASIYATYLGTPVIDDRVAKAKAEKNASGLTGSMGINIKPNDKLNIGMTYEFPTKLEFLTDVNSSDTLQQTLRSIGMDPFFVDGEKKRLDLPAILRIGIAYKLNPRWRLESSFLTYFEEDATWDDNEYGDKYNNTYEAGIAAEFNATDKIKLSAGFLYTWIGATQETIDDLNGGQTDWYSVGAGLEFAFRKDMAVNLGLAYTGFIDSITHSDQYDQLVELFYGQTDARKEYINRMVVVAFGLRFYL